MWRDIKIRYRQTLLGGLWAVLQPLIAMLILTFIFHRLAGVNSDGPPYPLIRVRGTRALDILFDCGFAVQQQPGSNQALDFESLFSTSFIPLGAIGALLLDLSLSLGLLGVLMFYYQLAGVGEAALAAGIYPGSRARDLRRRIDIVCLERQLRDVKIRVPFLIQMGIFVTPVIYPIRYIPGHWKILMGLNPMTGVVLGFRYALLGSASHGPSWDCPWL